MGDLCSPNENGIQFKFKFQKRTSSPTLQCEATWDMVFKSNDDHEILIDHANYQISRGKLKSFALDKCLNDECVNICLVLIQVLVVVY